MPLHTDEPGPVRSFQGLDGSVLSFRSYREPLSQGADSLVMVALPFYLANAGDFGEKGRLQQVLGFRSTRVVLVADNVRQVLGQRASTHDVDELTSVADTEDRNGRIEVAV